MSGGKHYDRIAAMKSTIGRLWAKIVFQLLKTARHSERSRAQRMTRLKIVLVTPAPRN
jgi:hypothetical protein